MNPPHFFEQLKLHIIINKILINILSIFRIRQHLLQTSLKQFLQHSTKEAGHALSLSLWFSSHFYLHEHSVDSFLIFRFFCAIIL